MPIYDFKCSVCNTVFDKLVKGGPTTKQSVVCPNCGSKRTKRRIARVAAHRGGASGGANGGDCAPSG